MRDVWVDVGDGSVVRTMTTRKLRGRELAIEAVFGDYRETGGVMFARRSRRVCEGDPIGCASWSTASS